MTLLAPVAPKPIDRTLFWAPWNGPGLEHLRLRTADIGYVATGTVLGLAEGEPFRLHYKIKCDMDWRVRKVLLDCLGPQGNAVRTLRATGRGQWKNDSGEILPGLEACHDVDIAVTPFTNTLAIRRLKLKPGQNAALRVLHVDVPTLRLRAVEQRYTCVELRPDGGLFTYEGPFRGFTGDLPLDADGLVIDYPDMFRRVYPA
ncbi:MAG: hypothetical protein BroJett029_21800 [Alphaproteobacteria bacterium]|nr:MAG: hypothetical protein BroJett029_21800 [Alphaproteobacteria bacterium]